MSGTHSPKLARMVVPLSVILSVAAVASVEVWPRESSVLAVLEQQLAFLTSLAIRRQTARPRTNPTKGRRLQRPAAKSSIPVSPAYRAARLSLAPFLPATDAEIHLSLGRVRALLAT